MGDDGSVNVPLQFSFPFYGKTFNNSWMYDNGVVSFLQPGTPGALNQWDWNSRPFSPQLGANYFIAPLWADIAPVPGVTTYTTQGDTTFQRYNWNNIAEFYSMGAGTGLRLNTFSLEIRPDGHVKSTYNQVNLQTSNVSVGTVGDSSLGEYKQIFFAPFGTPVTSIQNWTNQPDPCVLNPLSSSTCPGYNQAMLDQICPSNPLYSSSCPGYSQAYALQMLQSQPTATTTTTTTAPTTSSTPVNVVEDTTTTPTTVEVGGVTVSPTGTISAAIETVPDVVKQSAPTVSTVSVIKEDKPTISVNTLLSISRRATDDAAAIALNTTQNSIQQSQDANANPGDGMSVNLETGQFLSQSSSFNRNETTFVADNTNRNTQSRTENQTKTSTNDNNSQNTLIQNTAETMKVEVQQTTKNESVKSKGDESTMPGAVSIANIAVIPNGFNAYSVVLADAPFYSSKEIYRNQRVIDNQRTLRMMNSSSDSLHQKMIDSQYIIGN